MELLSGFGTDPKKCAEGTWLPVVDTDGDRGMIKIARLGNPRYRETFRRYADEERQKGGGKLDEAASERVLLRAMAEAIVVDWKDINVNGEVYPYTPDNAYKLLSMPELTDFRDWVTTQSNRFDNFRLESLEENAGK